MELTILMPCLNEERTLATCIRKAQAFIRRAGIDAEVLISDNGSTDSSVQVAERNGARVIHASERGYGAALLAGIHEARGRLIIMGDGDDSYDFSQLDAFLEQLRAGAHLVMGNRFQGGIAQGAMPPLHRYLGNPVLSALGRVFFGAPIGDFHCGLRGFVRQSILELGLTSPGMEFATEMVAKAACAHLVIAEVPTTLRPDGRDRPPHLRTWRDGWRHLLFMLLFSPRWLFLFPGLFLLAGGSVAAILLGFGPVRIGSVGFDVHSLLYASGSIIIGLLMIQFAFLTKWIGVTAGIVPPEKWIQQLQGIVRTEWGLIFGFILFSCGLIWSIELAGGWSEGGFSELNPQQKMREVIPAVTLMIVGLQICASTFLAAALHLTWKTIRAR